MVEGVRAADEWVQEAVVSGILDQCEPDKKSNQCGYRAKRFLLVYGDEHINPLFCILTIWH